MGCHRPMLEFWTVCLHTGLVRTNIGLALKPPVAEIKDVSIATVLL